MHSVTVRNIVFGIGKPKIIVSIMGKDLESLEKEAAFYQEINYDVLEWRVDYFSGIGRPESESLLKQATEKLRRAFPNKPVLFTFRTRKEGGEQDISQETYLQLNRIAVDSGQVDLIDLELFTGDEAVTETTRYAQSKGVKVIISNHDFNKTPPQKEIVQRLRKMEELGADIPKIAVMPQSAGDVLTLLAATDEMRTRHAAQPIITMSMGKLGLISRLAGNVFGSCATFGAAKTASAPGQINVDELGRVLDILDS